MFQKNNLHKKIRNHFCTNKTFAFQLKHESCKMTRLQAVSLLEKRERMSPLLKNLKNKLCSWQKQT